MGRILVAILWGLWLHNNFYRHSGPPKETVDPKGCTTSFICTPSLPIKGVPKGRTGLDDMQCAPKGRTTGSYTGSYACYYIRKDIDQCTEG